MMMIWWTDVRHRYSKTLTTQNLSNIVAGQSGAPHPCTAAGVPGGGPADLGTNQD